MSPMTVPEGHESPGAGSAGGMSPMTGSVNDLLARPQERM